MHQEVAILSSVGVELGLDDFSGGYFTLGLLKIWRLEF